MYHSLSPTLNIIKLALSSFQFHPIQLTNEYFCKLKVLLKHLRHYKWYRFVPETLWIQARYKIRYMYKHWVYFKGLLWYFNVMMILMHDTSNDLLSCSGDSAVWFTFEMWSPSLETLCFLKSFLVQPSCICYFTKWSQWIFLYSSFPIVYSILFWPLILLFHAYLRVCRFLLRTR